MKYYAVRIDSTVNCGVVNPEIDDVTELVTSGEIHNERNLPRYVTAITEPWVEPERVQLFTKSEAEDFVKRW
jgi:hypothetical protein